MAAARVRGVKRPTVLFSESDLPETQSKSRCRSPSRIRESPARRVTFQLHPITSVNLSSKSSGSTTNTSSNTGTSNTGTSNTGTSNTGTSSAKTIDNTNKAVCCEGHNSRSKWRDDVRTCSRRGIDHQYTNAFDVEIPLPVVEYCRAYLGSPGIRLFLEQTKDRDNWHPWDRCVKDGHEVDERQSVELLTEAINADEISDEVRGFLIKVFLQNNSLDRTVEVMAYHPKYLSLFLNTQRFLMQADGPLSFQERHYIAILAAAQHKCSYLVDIHTKAYMNFGGDPEWLKGLDYAPQRLRKLHEVNKFLAHQPWRITDKHIKHLLREPGRYSMAEMMQAIVLLAHFQSLTSFIYACGIDTESEQPSKAPEPSRKTSNIDIKRNAVRHNTSSEEGSPVEFLVEKMTRLARESLTVDQMRERFEKIEVQNAELFSESVATKTISSPDCVLRFVDEPDFVYEDFSSCKRKCGVSTFQTQDFSWYLDGYQLANHLYLNIGVTLDEKFNLAQKLTYYTMGDHADIDTSTFRLAIWNYVHSLFGICHDEYDYSEVHQLLERNLKTYIKTTMCYPERVTRQDYDGFMVGFKHSEKVHVNLMTMEARFQAQLMYSLRAITEYMCGRSA